MKNRSEAWLILIAVLATLAKIYCALTTFGTVDMLVYFQFARSVAEHGVLATYRASTFFNHPPLVGHYLGLAYQWAGGQPQPFALFIRLPGIVADLAVFFLLLRFRAKMENPPPAWALALFAASPVAFMISGYHGNTDPLIALGLLLAALAGWRGSAILCGVFLGLTCQIKIIPLIMAPVFFFFWLPRGKSLPFAVATGATLLLGWLEPLLSEPVLFLHQVLAYNSTWGWWGVTYLLGHSGLPALSETTSAFVTNPAQAAVVTTLKLLIVGTTIALSWRRRKCRDSEIFRSLAMVWVLFFVFAPGFGVQYLAWVGPFLLLFSSRWFAAFTAGSTFALFVFYQTISHGMPWNKGFDLKTTFTVWQPALLVPWAVFAILLAVRWKEFIAQSATGHESSPAVEPLEIPQQSGL